MANIREAYEQVARDVVSGSNPPVTMTPRHRLFGNWLSTRRQKLRLTQARLAETAGLSINTIHRWENGDAGGAHVAKLERLALALEVPFSHLEMVHLRSQEDYNRDQRALTRVVGLGLSDDDFMSLFLRLCEMTDTLADLDDIRSELPLEYEAFKAAASLLANKLRQLPAPTPLRRLDSDNPLSL